jgi:predicted Zn-dependent protease
MLTRVLPILCFSLLSACAGMDGGRGIPAPVEDRSGAGTAVQGQSVTTPAPAQPATPPAARTNPARSVVPGIDDLPPRSVSPGLPSPLPAPVPVAPAPSTSMPMPGMPATPEAALLMEVDAALAAGDMERAAAVAERAVRIAPRDANLWYRLASIRARQGRTDEAAGIARRALSFAAPDSPVARQIDEFLRTLP